MQLVYQDSCNANMSGSRVYRIPGGGFWPSAAAAWEAEKWRTDMVMPIQARSPCWAICLSCDRIIVV